MLEYFLLKIAQGWRKRLQKEERKCRQGYGCCRSLGDEEKKRLGVEKQSTLLRVENGECGKLIGFPKWVKIVSSMSIMYRF